VAAARHGELVSANAAFWALIDGTAPELPEPPVNVPRVLLHPNGLAPRILNVDVWAWHVIEALKRESARNPSERLDSLIAELRLEAFLPADEATATALANLVAAAS
jgi:MmyB-like transcription regulator ligand binding domain